MPLELQIIRANEFIRVGAEDRLDLETSKNLLAGLAAACRKRGIERALVDLRQLHPGPKPALSTQDLLALVCTFRDIGFSRELRLALLYSSDPHQRTRMFAFLGTLRGWSVRAFDDYETALNWLALSGEDPDEPSNSETPEVIPVQTSESKPPTTDSP